MMLPAGSLEAELPGYRPATSWAYYTTTCNTQSSAPEDGRDHRPKHVELVGITNKPLLLHLVGVYIICINDAWSNKYQTLDPVARYHHLYTLTYSRYRTVWEKFHNISDILL